MIKLADGFKSPKKQVVIIAAALPVSSRNSSSPSFTCRNQCIFIQPARILIDEPSDA
jgi:hypothetical protein